MIAAEHDLRASLADILGDDFPVGATSCFARRDVITFLIGATGEFIHVKMTPEQVFACRDAGLLGSFGVFI